MTNNPNTSKTKSIVLTETFGLGTRSILTGISGTVVDLQKLIHNVVKAGARPVLDSDITRHTTRAPSRPVGPTHCLLICKKWS